jgi:hypothetical protein
MTSANPWFLAASVAAPATCLAHVFLGGRLFAAPLLASDLHSPVKHTNYFCWHLVTAVVMAGAFLRAAFAAEAREAAIAGAALAGTFLAVNVIQNLSQRLSFSRRPQGAFFLVTVALAGAGLANG